jgi:midasin
MTTHTLYDHVIECKSNLNNQVDGALLDAMERGDWLVLEDANLCSPSVLDRLNAVLENEGEMMVNEQGTTAEGARIVRPAPGFRVFLTVDPKFGNVSRAMRNRCVHCIFFGILLL